MIKDLRSAAIQSLNGVADRVPLLRSLVSHVWHRERHNLPEAVLACEEERTNEMNEAVFADDEALESAS
jgi:hypothetical protein